MKMQAIISHKPGPPASLRFEEVTAPEPAPGELLIAVRACGVNFPDALIIEDLYQFKPARPFSPGGEIAGEVIAVGEGVENRKLGDRVMAFTTWGGFAESVVARADRVYPVPGDMPLDVAAAFMMTYGTAYHALHDRAKLRAHETVLVLGGAGGVGLAAVELAKAAGATVVAAVSTPEKGDVARAHGADTVVLYPAGSLERNEAKSLSTAFKQACGEKGADVIVDPVGGDYLEPALRTIAWKGRYLVIGFTAGVSKIPANLPLLKGCDILGVFWGSFSERFPKADQENAQALFSLYRQGLIRPEIARRYPLAEAANAIEALKTRTVAGKLVVTISTQDIVRAQRSG